MRRLAPVLVPVLLLSAVLEAAAADTASIPILPFEQVRPGMRGTGRTVFEGTRVDSFEVEVLGTLPDVAPDRDLILVRLSGGPLERTGVLAGMSGSPIFVDDRLIGAIAYTWGFSTEPIAGVTPIREMLALAELDDAEPARRATAGPTAELLEALRRPAAVETFFDTAFDALGGGRTTPFIPVPVSFAGLDPSAIRRLEPALDAAGLLPVQAGGGRDGERREPTPLEPGSAVGLKLVRGDVDVTATGTITWLEPDWLLGFGHPLFGLGAVDLPMTGAEVQALLPSLFRSARVASPTEEIGAVRQDRASGVLGRRGVRPRMIPVRLQLSGGSVENETYSFDIVEDPLLSPLLLYVTLNGLLTSKERPFGNASVRLRAGSVIKTTRHEDVALDNLFAGPRAVIHGTALPPFVLYLLMNNDWTPPGVAGVNLLLDYDGHPRTARVLQVDVDRYRVTPGSTVDVRVTLSPYRGPDRVLTRRIRIPPDTPAGPLVLDVGGPEVLARHGDHDEPVMPRSLEQLIRVINRLRRNDHVYVLATAADAGGLLGGERLSALPPSVYEVLTRPRREGRFVPVPARPVLEESLQADAVVEGGARVELMVTVP